MVSWLSTADSIVGFASGFIAVTAALGKVYMVRRQSGYFSVDPSAPLGDPLRLSFTNSGRATIYHIVGTVSLLAQDKIISEERFTAIRLAEGESTTVPVPESITGPHAMRYDELSAVADVIQIVVNYRNGPRSLISWKRKAKFGSALLSQDHPILFSGRTI